MTKEKLKRYGPSGRTDVSIVWKLPVIFFILLIAVYTEYQLKISVISAYFFPLSFVVLLIVTGLATSLTIRWSKIRSVPVAVVIGTLIGAGILYTGWLLILPSRLSSVGIQVVPLITLLTPSEVVGYAAEIASTGWPELSNIPFASELLAFAWTLEAMALFFYPAYKARSAVEVSVFCESCNEWANEEKGLVAFHHPAQEMLEQSFLAADLGYMDNAKAIFNAPMSDYYRIDGIVCYACNDFFGVTLNRVYKASDIDKGRVRPLVKQLLVPRAYFQHLQVVSSHFPAPERD